MSNTTITIERETLNDWQVITVHVGDDMPATACAELTIYCTGRKDEYAYIAYVSCMNNFDDGIYKEFTGKGNHETARAAAMDAIYETVEKLYSPDTHGYKDYELADWAMQISYLMSETRRRF